MVSKTDPVHKKIADLQKMNTSYLKEIKALTTNLDTTKRFQIISYFTFSFNIFHDADHANFILGSFHIQNIGNHPLTNPYICLKISKESPFDLSGKFLYKDFKQKMNLSNAWERMNDPEDKQEFWLKPKEKQILEPSESLLFSNFQVKWLPESSYAGSIMGYTYGDEIKDGMTALNQINISGTLPGEGELNE